MGSAGPWALLQALQAQNPPLAKASRVEAWQRRERGELEPRLWGRPSNPAKADSSRWA